MVGDAKQQEGKEDMKSQRFAQLQPGEEGCGENSWAHSAKMSTPPFPTYLQLYGHVPSLVLTLALI